MRRLLASNIWVRKPSQPLIYSVSDKCMLSTCPTGSLTCSMLSKCYSVSLYTPSPTACLKQVMDLFKSVT